MNQTLTDSIYESNINNIWIKHWQIHYIIVSTYFDPPEKFSKNFSRALVGTNSKSRRSNYGELYVAQGKIPSTAL